MLRRNAATRLNRAYEQIGESESVQHQARSSGRHLRRHGTARGYLASPRHTQSVGAGRYPLLAAIVGLVAMSLMLETAPVKQRQGKSRTAAKAPRLVICVSPAIVGECVA
jgi:hypothetical protein